MTAFVGQTDWQNVYLVDPGTSDPILGALFSAVTVTYRYAGDPTFLPKTLVSADWQEQGQGYYFLRFNPAQLTKVGAVCFKVTGAGTFPQIGFFDVDPAPLAFLGAPPLCTVTGNIQELGGRPNVGAEVVFRVTDSPAQVGSSILAASRIVAQTDAYGNFSAALLQGATALVEIGVAGVVSQITVPAAGSATLLSLLPPL